MVANSSGMEILGADDMGDPDGGIPEPLIGVLVPCIVERRDDPQNLGRVQVRNGVFFENGSTWIYPAGVNGGAPQTGRFKPPLKGALVFVFWPYGRVLDDAYYLSSGWTSDSEVPSGVEIEGDRGRYVLEKSKQWEIVEDDREGVGEFTIRHLSSGNSVCLKENGHVVLDTSVEGRLGDDATEKIARADRVESLLSSWYTVLNPFVSGALAPPTNLGADKWKVE